jgi:hypothetical protein
MISKVIVEGSVPTNTPPQVAIVSPPGGTNLPAGTPVTVRVSATDSDGTIAKVVFFDGASVLGEDSTDPYEVTLTFAAGTHSLTAVATDNQGASSTSAGVLFTVSAEVIPDPVPVFIAKVPSTCLRRGAQERPAAVRTDGTGAGVFTLVGNDLGFNVTYGNLSSVAAGSHIHGPAGAFASAPVLIGLDAFNGGAWGVSGSLVGRVTLDAANLVNVLNRQTYINVQSVNFPGGEIRGQISP